MLSIFVTKTLIYFFKSLQVMITFFSIVNCVSPLLFLGNIEELFLHCILQEYELVANKARYPSLPYYLTYNWLEKKFISQEH